MLKSDEVRARQLADLIVKNTYRTPMTRGMKGCYVYRVDTALAGHLRSRIRIEAFDAGDGVAAGPTAEQVLHANNVFPLRRVSAADRRIDEVYGIGYDDDIAPAIAILKGVVDAEPRVLADPAPLILVESLADSSVNILLRVWTARADWWATKLDLLHQYKVALDKGGISIPFPQRDLHIVRNAARPALSA